MFLNDLISNAARRFAMLCGLVALIASMSVASAQNLTVLEDALRNAGYQLYNPPRANWGPGFVFAGDVVNGRIKHVEEICPSLYKDLPPPEEAAIVLPDFKSEDRFTWRVAIDFLKGLLGGELMAAGEDEQKAQIQWHNLQEISYPKMIGWLANGDPRPITKACRAAIKDLKDKNLFDGRVFVIVRAVAPRSLTYDFTRVLKGDAGASAQFSTLVNTRLQGKGKLRSSTQLEITRRLYVGYAMPVRIEDWVPRRELSGELVEVHGTPKALIIEK